MTRRMYWLLVATVALWLVALALTLSAQSPAWTPVGRVSGLTGTWAPHYTPVVLLENDKIRVYSSQNKNGSKTGDFWLYDGTWSKVGTPTLVLSKSLVQAVDGDSTEFLRTSGVARGSVSGMYYALLHPCVPPGNSACRPAWASSLDGVRWTYYGHIRIDGTLPDINSDSDALVVQEDKPSTFRDDLNPANNRFLGWENEVYVSEDGQSVLKNFVLIYSADGVDWRYARDASGHVIDSWPRSQYPWWPIYQTAARTSSGYHLLFAAPTNPATAIMHLVTTDGTTMQIVEAASPLFDPAGESHHAPNVVYEPIAGVLHALVGGQHWTGQP